VKVWEIQEGKPARDVMETQIGKTYCVVQVRFRLVGNEKAGMGKPTGSVRQKARPRLKTYGSVGQKARPRLLYRGQNLSLKTMGIVSLLYLIVE
jgi:hypothetical protein